MRNFIFITNEGYTFQPASESIEPDIENCQVIGFSSGNTEELAFENLLKENPYLLSTNFDDILIHELAPNYKESNKHFFLSAIR